MSKPDLDTLLEPTLQTSAPTRPLFSVRANFFVAFFGGVYAAALFGGLNLARMQRLRQDIWIPIVAALLWSGFILWAIPVVRDSPPQWMEFAGSPSTTVRRLGSVVGLALFGLLYWKGRDVYRAQDLNGIESPNPWPAALASMGVAFAITTLLAGLVLVAE